MSVQDFFWLPPDTPFGNLTKKIFSIGQRLAHANVRLHECYTCWQNAMTSTLKSNVGQNETDARLFYHSDNLVQYNYAGEEAVTAIRRCADELVTLIWYLTQHIETGQFPQKLKVDMISSFFRESQSLFNNKHNSFLDELNQLSNAHKHSFAQSDTTIIGTEEPCVYLLSHPHNDIKKDCEFDVVPVRRLVNEFNEFQADCFKRLRELGESMQNTNCSKNT